MLLTGEDYLASCIGHLEHAWVDLLGAAGKLGEKDEDFGKTLLETWQSLDNIVNMLILWEEQITGLKHTHKPGTITSET